MSITSERFIVLVLSLLYAIAVFCFSSSALPAQPKQTSEGTSTGSNEVANLNVTGHMYESYDLQARKEPVTNRDNARVGTSKEPHDQKISENTAESTTKKIYTQKISGSKTTEKPKKQNSSNSSNSSGINTNSNASIAKTWKRSLPTENIDLSLPSDLNSTNVVNKRSSATKLFTAEMENSSIPVEIQVKTYTVPPNASAIIEVRPKASNTYEVDRLSYPDQYPSPVYQYPYPQETKKPQDWYMQQYRRSLPPSLTYVPTEELLHSQSFSNSPGFSTQLLYQYPVKEAALKKQIFSQRQKCMFPNLVNNQTKIPKPNPKDDQKLLPNYAVEPLARISPYKIDTPPQIQYSSPQDYLQPYFLPRTNENQNSIYTHYQPNLNDKPTVTKYITKSYTLKTHPKLEWVPL